MTDDQIRSRLREAGVIMSSEAREAMVHAVRDLLSAETQQTQNALQAARQAHNEAADVAGARSAELIRLRRETQQIREERDALVQAHRKAYRLLSAAAKRTAERAEQAVAETQALREALELWVKFTEGAKDKLSGMVVLAHLHGMNYDGPTWEEPLAKTKALLQRLTPASTRTGEKVEPENPSGTTSASSDNEGPLSRHFMRVKP